MFKLVYVLVWLAVPGVPPQPSTQDTFSTCQLERFVRHEQSGML